jgi:hypothetical protein
MAQGRAKQVPNEIHFLALQAYYRGDFRSALKGFREAGRSGFASTEGRWIDSICFHAMMGESAYQLGDNVAANEQFTAAIKMFLVHRDWMLRVEFPDSIQARQGISKAPAWGPTSRNTTIGQFQDRYQSFQGRLDNTDAIKSGGVVAPAQLYPVYVTEIVRCTCLAIARRREILGPACEHDPLTAELVDALARRPGKPNHWSQCWVELPLGLALASANRTPQAASELTKSLMAAGTFDHPLTCVGLLELGKLAFEAGKYDAAMTFFHEATISAAFFDRYEVMEEAFRLGGLAHILSGQKGVYPPLPLAAAQLRKYPVVTASICTALADCLTSSGDLTKAAAAIAEGSKAMARTDMQAGVHGARLNFQAARVALQSGNVRQGGQSLAAALAFQKASSKWLYRISLVDGLYQGGGVTERIADLLFTDVLREPTRLDWAVDPLDTLAVGTMPHGAAYEHWFELALRRKEQDKAFEISDRIRRHRFYSTQPLGGRVLALRWVLEAPLETLSAEAQQQRQELMARYPQYAELSKQAAAIEKELAAAPLAPSNDDEAKKLQSLYTDLANKTAAQEVLLNLMSLERVAAEFAFPPLLSTKDLSARIPEGTLVFSYLATASNVHAFALTRDRYGHFVVAQPAKVKADVVELLKGLGQFDRNQPVDGDDLAKDDWKKAAQRLAGQLTNDTKPDDWAKYKELVIVPDGVLWYLPFEILQAPAAQGTESILTKMPVRYAPTLALSVPDKRPVRRATRTAVVAGRMLPREEDALTRWTSEQLGSIENVSLLGETLPAPSALFTAACDRFVLFADLEEQDKLPYGWSPAKVDAGKGLSTLSDWTLLPLGGAEQVVFPGFHTPAETSLKRGGTGEEVFLSVCGLMASGSRTILLSRWRVGGQSTVELMREFIQELPHSAAAVAWRRSVQLSAARVLDPAAEPRLRAGRSADGLKADHPFFWAGYLLVDTGVGPPAEEPLGPPAANHLDKPAQKAAERPAGIPVEKPAAKPTDKPAEKPVENPAEPAGHDPLRKPAAEPADRGG